MEGAGDLPFVFKVCRQERGESKTAVLVKATRNLVGNGYHMSLIIVESAASHGAGIACWLERRTRDRKVASSNPGRSGGRFLLLQSQFCVLTLIRCPIHPRVTTVARKRHRSFCQNCRWQVTPKYAYAHDPSKSEWADYAAVQAECGNLSGNKLTRNSSGNTRS